MNKRRRLVVALGASLLASPFDSFAQQQGKVWRVGFLSQRSRPESLDADDFGGFPRGMRELGYVEGRNLVIEWRFADGKLERLTELAAELVRLKVDVILAAGTPATSVAQRATATIPIVMASIADPVGSGLVASLAHPGGNTTGTSNYGNDISPKLLEMILSIVPKLSRAAVLMNPDNPAQSIWLKNIQISAQKTGVKILPVEARTPQEIERAFSVISREKAGAVIVSGEGLFMEQQRRVAELAAKYRLPSISNRKVNVEVGYLLSYGPNNADNFRRPATYVDKILKGAKPADLPVEQPTTFELTINGKTAKALGIKIPKELLLRADQVIE
jgi:putative ABC transport system substrate-binding protein